MKRGLNRFTKVAVWIAIVLVSSTLSVHAANELKLTPVYQQQPSNVIRLNANQTVQLVGEQGSVKAECSSESQVGCGYDKIINYQPLCTTGRSSVDYTNAGESGDGGGSVTVDKNSNIQVWKVTSPMALFSGSQYVKTDRMQISNEFPTFPSNRDYIDPDMARGLCAPGVDCDDVDDISEDADKGSFAVHASASLENQESEETSAALIEPTLNSACPEIQESDPNPDRTNKLAAWMEPSFQTPGNHENDRDYGQMSCVDSAPGEYLETSAVFAACVDEKKPFDFITSAVFKIEKWAECLADEEQCEQTELFAIRVDAIFGSQSDCKEGECANRYFDTARKSGSAPSSQSFAPEGAEADVNNSFAEPLYVSTPCQVRIDFDRIEDVQCLWDVSPLREWYERQKKMAGPGDETMPRTFEEYFDKVNYDIERRGLRCE
jgi:hypothetical protein